MYIVAIAWLFTAFMLSLGQTSIVAGVLSFLLWGPLPLALLLWLVGTPARQRHRAHRDDKDAQAPNADRDHAA